MTSFGRSLQTNLRITLDGTAEIHVFRFFKITIIVSVEWSYSEIPAKISIRAVTKVSREIFIESGI